MLYDPPSSRRYFYLGMANFPANVWTHFVLSFKSGSGMFGYKNGRLHGSSNSMIHIMAENRIGSIQDLMYIVCIIMFF